MCLTQQEIDLCKEDVKLSRNELSQKYNLDQGGEHPVATRESFDRNGLRDPFNPTTDYTTEYRVWTWHQVKEVAEGN
jgi:hypothetical protein